MRFPPHFLDELRARLPVSEVCGKRVRLKKEGREWKGLSPFNKERTPSFFVNDQKGFYHDFSSGRHGDIFAFVMETEGVTFPEAVERLASQAGLSLPKVTPEAEAVERRRKTLHEIMELAAKFFETALAARPGVNARAYITERGISPTLQFRVGYAPAERFALKEHLGALGISTEDMIEAGLLVHGDGIPVPYDRFRDRVMFPIKDLVGRVVAFGGRALDPDVSAKYLNSPETTLFHKGSLLYNGGPARQASHLGAKVIVVEGYIDVIAMVSAGYEGTVAPLGTALTEDQLALLWKLSDEPVLCFDGDSAGRRAAWRAAEVSLPLLTAGKSLLFAALPNGQDPDDIIRSGGKEAIAEIIGATRPLSDVVWARLLENRIDTPERRAALENHIKEMVGTITDESVRRNYRNDYWNRLRSLPRPPFQRHSDRRRPALLAVNPQLGTIGSVPAREALILMAAITHPWLLESEAERLATIDFANADAEIVRKAVLDIPDAGVARGFLLERCPSSLRRIEAAVSLVADWPAREGADPEAVRQWWAQVIALHQQEALRAELKQAETALGAEMTDANFQRLLDVKGQIASLEIAFR